MKTTLLALATVSAAYLATADEIPGVKEEAQNVVEAVVDPMTGKVWDGQTSEWVPFAEFAARSKQRGTVYYEQIPFVPPSITNGLDVISQRQEAIKRHWEYVLWLQEYQAMPRFR